jgi:hypothetical protein
MSNMARVPLTLSSKTFWQPALVRASRCRDAELPDETPPELVSLVCHQGRIPYHQPAQLIAQCRRFLGFSEEK